MKINKKTLAVFIINILILPAIAFAQASQLETFVCNIRGALYLIAGSIVVIGWIVAGILYLTSAGNPEKTGTAKKAMIAAITGTILIVIATLAGSLIANLLGVPMLTTSC